MKTLLTILGGAVTITEQGGVFTLSFNEGLGGGQAAGIVVGTGQIKLNAMQGLQLAEALLNAHLPAAYQGLAASVEGVVNEVVGKLE